MFRVVVCLSLFHIVTASTCGGYTDALGNCSTCPEHFSSAGNDVSCRSKYQIETALYMDTNSSTATATEKLARCELSDGTVTCNEIVLGSLATTNIASMGMRVNKRYNDLSDADSRTYPVDVCLLYNNDELHCNMWGGIKFQHVLQFTLDYDAFQIKQHLGDKHKIYSFNFTSPVEYYYIPYENDEPKNNIAGEIITAPQARQNNTTYEWEYYGPTLVEDGGYYTFSGSETDIFKQSMRSIENPRNIFFDVTTTFVVRCVHWSGNIGILNQTFFPGNNFETYGNCRHFVTATVRCIKNTTMQAACHVISDTEIGSFDPMANIPPHDEILHISMGGHRICGTLRASNQVFHACWGHYTPPTGESWEQGTPGVDMSHPYTNLPTALEGFSQTRKDAIDPLLKAPYSDRTDIRGCMKPAACNFDYRAYTSEYDALRGERCMFPYSERYACDSTYDKMTRFDAINNAYVHNPGKCVSSVDADGNGWCDDDEVYGCGDPSACNIQVCKSQNICPKVIGQPCFASSDCYSNNCIRDTETNLFRCAHGILPNTFEYKRKHASGEKKNVELTTKTHANFCRYPYSEFFRCKQNDILFSSIQGIEQTRYDNDTTHVNDTVYLEIDNREENIRCIDIPDASCVGTCSFDKTFFQNKAGQYTTNDACCECGGGRIFDTSRGRPVIDFDLYKDVPDQWTERPTDPEECFFNPFNYYNITFDGSDMLSELYSHYEQPEHCVTRKETHICADPDANNTVSEIPIELDSTQIITGCTYSEHGGCLDPYACNYNYEALFDDHSCTYPSLQKRCDGSDIDIRASGWETPCVVSEWNIGPCNETTLVRTNTRSIIFSVNNDTCPHLQETDTCSCAQLRELYTANYCHNTCSLTQTCSSIAQSYTEQSCVSVCNAY